MKNLNIKYFLTVYLKDLPIKVHVRTPAICIATTAMIAIDTLATAITSATATVN